MRWGKYLWRAFNARPFGMFVPPLWFGLAAAGLAGAFISPPLFLIGVGLTAITTGLIAASGRFRQLVDATERGPAVDTRSLLIAKLDSEARARQSLLDRQCDELQRVLEGAKAGEEHIRGIWQLAELHLRLLAARSAAAAVTSGEAKDIKKQLTGQIEALNKRLAASDIDADLREALDDQGRILAQRLAMQNEADRRLALVDAELDRIREQLALIREQALLTSDPAAIRRSVDSLAAFLNESGRWLQDQEKLFDGLDFMSEMPVDPVFPSSSSITSQARSSQAHKDKRIGESQ